MRRIATNKNWDAKLGLWLKSNKYMVLGSHVSLSDGTREKELQSTK